MHISAHLDFDVVALQSDDRLSLLLELKAPAASADEPRAPVSLEVVLDRSGSMADGRLYAAQGALHTLVDKLGPEDVFGLVAFDHEVIVPVAAGPLADKEAVRQAIWSLAPRGMTNLSAGYLRGIQEARRGLNGARSTLLLLSDGHANEGVVDAGRLELVARGAGERGITTSTLGVGLGYDEVLMSAVAAGGAGNALFAEEPDAAGAAIAGEVEGLLTQTVQAAHLEIETSDAVSDVAVINDMPVQAVAGGLMVELGDFYGEEERKLVLQFDVPAIAGLGLAKIADIELRYVELPALKTHTVTVPVHVNVVPGDEAAGRVANATVRTEVAFQEAQSAKRQAAEALRRGEVDAAAALYDAAGADLSGVAACAPAEAQPDIHAEAELLRELAQRATVDDAARLSKFTEADRHRKARQRGRG
jgi:Ca-activated chloride channel family protein